MTPTRPVTYTNQFKQSVYPGEPDLQINQSGVLSGVLSPNQTDDLVAGTRVKLDATNTNPTIPQFVAAADNEDAIGCIIKTVQRSTFRANLGGVGTPGDMVEVMFFAGPVLWQVADATIAPQDQLEAVTETIGGKDYPFFQPLNSGKLAGLALDPAVANGIFRMFVLSGLTTTL